MLIGCKRPRLGPLLALLLLASCPTREPHRRPPPKPTAAPPLPDDIRVCSRDRWCWENPMPQGNALAALWYGSSRRIVVVGRHGTALHFNGNVWQRYATNTVRDLRAVVGDSRGAVYAAGAEGILLRLERDAWVPLRSGTTGLLRALWLGEGKLVAVGAAGSSVVCDERAARPCQTIPGAPPVTLRALAGAKLDGLIAAGGGGVVLRCDGRRWQRLATPTKERLFSATTLDSGAVLVGGGHGTLLRCGAAGCTALASGVTGWLVALTSAGRTVHALARRRGKTTVYRLRFDAKAALASKPRALFTIARRLRAIGGDGARALLAAGDVGTVVRYNGKEWLTAMPTGSTANLRAVWGTSATDVFAVGERGTALHFDGKSWQPLASGTKANLHALCAARDGLALAGGDGGALLRCDAKTCTAEPSPGDFDLRGLWAKPDGTVFAVGRQGAVLLRRGGRWRRLESPTRADLNAVWGDGQRLLIAGAAGTILRHDGGALRAVASGTRRALRAVWGAGGAVWVAGDGALLRCDDSGCLAERGAMPGDLGGIWGDAKRVVAVGRGGVALQRDGDGWREQQTGFGGALTAVWGAASGDLFAVGDGGAIVHRIP